MEVKQKLIVTTRSWQKDSFGLHDFESKDLQRMQFTLDKTSKSLCYWIVAAKIVRVEKPLPGEQKKLNVELYCHHDSIEEPDHFPVP